MAAVPSIPDLFQATSDSVVNAYLDIAYRGLPSTIEYLHFIYAFGLLVWATSMFASYAVFGHRRPMNAVIVKTLSPAVASPCPPPGPSSKNETPVDPPIEVRSPVTAMRGYLETLMMSELALDESTRARYLGVIGDETARLERLIGELLDLARLEGGGGTLRIDRVPVASRAEARELRVAYAAIINSSLCLSRHASAHLTTRNWRLLGAASVLLSRAGGLGSSRPLFIMEVSAVSATPLNRIRNKLALTKSRGDGALVESVLRLTGDA